MVELAGGNVVHVGLYPDDNFTITRELLERHVTPASRIIMLNSPNNPTGRVATEAELQAIADLAIEHDLLVFTDEMYEKIIFDGNRHISIATLPGMAERTLTFNGLSKAYAMTGWRLGYVAGPNALIKKISTVHSHSVTCATSFAQAGGVAAYEGPQDIINEMVSAWDRRRNLITEGFNSIKGMKVQTIEGAFYGFVDGRETGLDTAELSKKILDEAFVAVVPGTAFGDAGEGHFRLSFATSDDLLKASIGRIQELFGSR
jgi:aspartate aminotransferase